MTWSEKVNNSMQGHLFTLYREGLFLKCYNQDAMLFALHIRPYKVSVKYVKNIDSKVLSLGFPESELQKGSLSIELIAEKLGAESHQCEDDSLKFHLKEDMKQGYTHWYYDVVNESSVGYSSGYSTAHVSGVAKPNERIIGLIKGFDLANSTPMQALSFIQQLKNEVINLCG